MLYNDEVYSGCFKMNKILEYYFHSPRDLIHSNNPAHAYESRGYVINVGVHVCDPKSLNGTLAGKSPIQALTVEFSSNL